MNEDSFIDESPFSDEEMIFSGILENDGGIADLSSQAVVPQDQMIFYANKIMFDDSVEIPLNGPEDIDMELCQ